MPYKYDEADRKDYHIRNAPDTRKCVGGPKNGQYITDSGQYYKVESMEDCPTWGKRLVRREYRKETYVINGAQHVYFWVYATVSNDDVVRMLDEGEL